MKLIFIYNADSGKLNALFDMGHKLVSPDSYECDLCNLTHGAFAERKAWKKFRQSTSSDLMFLHKDEFEKQFEDTFSYPIILKQVNVGLEILISTEELRSLANAAELIDLIHERVV